MTNIESDSSREWAAQAYALLKKKQEEAKQDLQKQSVNQNFSEFKNAETVPEKVFNEPQAELGEFDDDFTWSAMILAAQGKKINQVSIDEIDWLSKLRRGLEETRKGFVTELLDKLGDDPLTPESLDDLERL